MFSRHVFVAAGLAAYRRAIFAGIVLLSGSLAASAQVTIAIGTGTGYPGSSVTVPVNISVTTPPATAAFRVTFDSTILTLTDATIGAAASQADKSLDWDTPSDGVGSFAIVGVNQNVMGSGVLLTMTFTINGAASPTTKTLTGGSQSSSDADAQPITTDITNGSVTISACVTPGTPSGLVASDGSYSDRVRLTWGAVSGATSYKIYRNASNNSASAVQLNQVALSTFDDFSAAGASSGSSGGCGGGSTPKFTTYYYWIRAISPCGQSNLAGPDTGYRGSAKSAAPGEITPKALPSKALSPYISLDSSVALRLTSDEAIDAASVWGSVKGNDFEDSTIKWVPVGDFANDGWVVYQPATPWVPGEIIWMTVGASTVSGAPLSPVIYAFQAGPAGAIGVIAKSEGTGAPTVTALTDGTVPDFVEGVGQAFAVEPQGLLSNPETAWFPVPSGFLPDTVDLYYFDGKGIDGTWHAAESVTGLLASQAVATTDVNGITYVGYQLQFGGVMRLGTHSGAFRPLQASMLPPATRTGALGNAVLLAGVATILYVAHRRRIRVVVKADSESER